MNQKQSSQHVDLVFILPYCREGISTLSIFILPSSSLRRSALPWHSVLPLGELQRRAEAAQRELFRLGITFTVYSDRDATDPS